MILLIEDNPVDAEAITRAFSVSNPNHSVTWFETGDDALRHLNLIVQDDTETKPELPRLIILDLNLPGMDGRDVLVSLKSSEHLKSIPVVVLSSTTSAIEVTKVYANGANSFLRKPISFESLSEMIHFTNQYWFDIAVAPKVL